MKPRTVHKYAGDDPTATRTACGLRILYWTHKHYENRAVDADVRRVTCGNCAKTTRIRYIEREHK